MYSSNDDPNSPNSSGPGGSAGPDAPLSNVQPLHEQLPQTHQPQALTRVPSGIEGLDTILNGGFLQGGIYFISGQPGTGKTILSNQIAFNHVASGGRVVFVSILSETHARMFSHLSSLSFFNLDYVGDSLYYISGYGTVQKEGLKGLLTLLQGAVRDNKASLLIIDGTLTAEAFTESEVEFKEFIHRLQSYADAHGCTVLMLSSTPNSEHEVRTADRIAGQTTVDGLIHLSNRLVGLKQGRELHVQKFRGSGFLGGVHTLEITADGVQVYPRVEAMVAGRLRANGTGRAERTRLAFGVEQLDAMLRGGVLVGSSTVLLGPPGSGKTLLGLTYLAEGARQGQHGLYFGLHETPSHAIDAADLIGLDFSGLVESGRISMLWQPALEGSLDVLAHELFTAVREGSVRRLFIDGLDAPEDVSDHPERIPLFFTALMGELRDMGVTTLTTVELDALFGPSADIPIEGVSARVENIIFMRYVEMQSELQRIISILKTRRSSHEGTIREFKITDEGIKVGGKFEFAEGILTGVARTLRATTK
jgi:circadian clock protein KaiC